MKLSAAVTSGFCWLRILYFFLEVRLSAHCWAFIHYFSEISRPRCVRDLGSGIARASTWLKYSSYSTPRASGSSAASLAHSSAFSFPGTILCAGHHRISMVVSGLALRSTAMCFLAWSAYIWPGPDSSEAIRLTAAWASVKIVIHPGAVSPRSGFQ